MRSTGTLGTSATKRCAVAAAGMGMVLASFAGAAASANAATHNTGSHRSPVSSSHSTPNITAPAPSPALGATAGAPVEIPVDTMIAGTSVALPTVTVTDPGILTSGQTVRVELESNADGVGLDDTVTPTVTATGATVSGVAIADNHVSFTVTKTLNSDTASYAVSGMHVTGDPGSSWGALGIHVISSGAAPQPEVATFPVGAVTQIIPAVSGQTAPDTAAILFDDLYHSNGSAVLASDYEPQDAESANFLAGALTDGPDTTGILLTDPTTLSPAAATALHTNGVSRVYIVGGTSVVSAGIQTQLENDGYTVVRLAGADQYATNKIVVDYVADQFPPAPDDGTIDYSQTRFNDTSGESSPTSTSVGNQKTAIIAAGSSTAYQDGLVSGPVSYIYHLPVILTATGSLSATAQQLLTEGGYKQVILLGGPAAVSDNVVDQLTTSTDSGGAGVTVFRVAGQDASDTSTKLASFLVQEGGFAPLDLGPEGGGVILARGNGFQDPLAAGPYLGSLHAPIALTENATAVGAPLTSYLKSLGGLCLFAVQAVGGPLSVTPAVQQAAVDAEFSGLASCHPDFQATPATAPVNLQASEVNDTTIHLAFTVPDFNGGDAITGYQYSTDGGDTWTYFTPTGNDPFTVNLTQTTSTTRTYEVRVVTDDGGGAASNSATVSTTP